MSDGGTSDLTLEALKRLARGEAAELDVHLTLVERDVALPGTKTVVHCHHLAIDANGRAGARLLAEFMRDCVLEYAIPRSLIQDALARAGGPSGSLAALTKLHEKAKSLFTSLARTGEGGELLLFLLAERFLRLPQALCKMALKTSPEMHYHGSDGIYVSLREDGTLLLHWGESKVYADVASGMKACVDSLAPFLRDADGGGAARTPDLFLLSQHADLGDPTLTAGLRLFFDQSQPLSRRVRYCGLALVGFDSRAYPADDAEALADQVTSAAREALTDWSGGVAAELRRAGLERFDIHFFCVPLPSAEGFRAAFLEAIGQGRATQGTEGLAASRGRRGGAGARDAPERRGGVRRSGGGRGAAAG